MMFLLVLAAFIAACAAFRVCWYFLSGDVIKEFNMCDTVDKVTLSIALVIAVLAIIGAGINA